MRRRLPLARSIGEAHRRYMRMVNFREGWRGAVNAAWNTPVPLASACRYCRTLWRVSFSSTFSLAVSPLGSS